MGTGSIEVTEATVVDEGLVEAMARLVPQLSSSGPPPDAEALEVSILTEADFRKLVEERSESQA